MSDNYAPGPRKPTTDDHYREASRHYMARTDTHNGEVRKAVATQNILLTRIAEALGNNP